MTKRKWLIVGITLATVAFAVPVVAYVFRDPINRSTCERINEGMSEAEVVRILGRPCDANWPHACPSVKAWDGPAGKLYVWFSKTGNVFATQYVEQENSVWHKARRWSGVYPDGYDVTTTGP